LYPTLSGYQRRCSFGANLSMESSCLDLTSQDKTLQLFFPSAPSFALSKSTWMIKHFWQSEAGLLDLVPHWVGFVLLVIQVHAGLQCTTHAGSSRRDLS
jgi:hypothetical protein